MDSPAHPRDRNGRLAQRRDLLRGSISLLALCVLPLVGGCSLVDRTVDLAAGLVGEEPSVAANASSSGSHRRRVQTADIAPSEAHTPDLPAGYRVIWDLDYLPSSPLKKSPAKASARPPADPADDLESRIAPAAGGTPIQTAPPTSSGSRSDKRSPTGSARQSVGMKHRVSVESDSLASTSKASGKQLSILYPPTESELSERDKVQLSLLVWPHLEDRAVTVKVRSYLPTPEPGIGPAPVLQVHRGMNVRLYLTHLGLPNDRIALTLVGTEDPQAPAHRVEVEVAGSKAPEEAPDPIAKSNKERAAQADLERTAGLEAFHQALRDFARQSPYASPARNGDLIEAPSSPADERPQMTNQEAAPLPASGPDKAPPGKPKPKLLQALSVERPASDRMVEVVAVQLASLPDRAQAEDEWDRIAAAYPDLLAAQRLDLQEVELPGRGRYHRVRTGPLGSTGEARRLCAQLKARGQDCLTVKSMRPLGSSEQLARRKQ